MQEGVSQVPLSPKLGILPPSGKDLNVTYDGQSVAIWLCAGVNIPTERSRADSYKQVCESPAMFVDVINGSINILDNFKSAG